MAIKRVDWNQTASDELQSSLLRGQSWRIIILTFCSVLHQQTARNSLNFVFARQILVKADQCCYCCFQYEVESISKDTFFSSMEMRIRVTFDMKLIFIPM